MSKKEEYLNQKKKNLFDHVCEYNKRVNLSDSFLIDSDDFEIDKTFCNPNFCANCGYCCLTFPCIFAPSDFMHLSDLNYMRNLLNTGIICISDSYKSHTLLVRVRGVGDLHVVSLEENIKYNYQGYNPCIIHSNHGCLLSSTYRPTEGLLHYPFKRYEHITMYSITDYEREYERYQDVLEDLMSEYENREGLSYEDISEEHVKKLEKYMAGYRF